MTAPLALTPYGVACLITRDKPPDWLAPGLARWAELLGKTVRMATSDHDGFKREVDHMLWAIDYLERTLPWFLEYPWDLPSGVEDETEDTLNNLYSIREVVEAAKDRSAGGPKPHIQRGICAGVIVEAWTLVHGEVPQGRSEKLFDICERYWLMCGGAPVGPNEDPLGRWRRPVEWALEHDRERIKNRLRP